MFFSEEKRTESLLECGLFEHDRKLVLHFTNGFSRTFSGGPPQNCQAGIDSSGLTCFFSCSIKWTLLHAIRLLMTRQNVFMDTRRRLGNRITDQRI